MITIRETGRYLNRLIADLTKPDPWFDRPRVEWEMPLPGLYFSPKPGVRQGEPPDYLPHLLLFPPPYHPLEVAMIHRGWGGRYPSYSLDRVREIDAARSSYDRLIDAAVKWLHLPRTTAHLLFHVCTPHRVNSDRDGEAAAGRAREKLYGVWGLDPRGLFWETNRVSNEHTKRFWGDCVYGETEL